MRFKFGVDISKLQAPMLMGAMIINRVIKSFVHDYTNAPYEPTITSGNDGTHHPNSLHYVGLALDWRTKDLPSRTATPVVQRLIRLLQEELGVQFDVVLEDDHIHTEFDPK